MRLVSYDDHRVGVWEPEGIHDVTDLLGDHPPLAAPLRTNELIARFDELAPEIERRRRDGPFVARSRVRLRSAIPRPVNFLAAPVNYRAHGDEMTGPISAGPGTAADLGFFVKAAGSLSGADDPIELPDRERRFDYEGEIGIVIGRRARGVTRDHALDHVFGYTLALDATMRMTETEREERTMRKSFHRLCPCGPTVVTADEIPDPAALELRLWVGDELRQHGRLADLVVDVPGLVELASGVLSLEPGDLILTGSPAGIGPMAVGDEIRLGGEPIGEMRLPVTRRPW